MGPRGFTGSRGQLGPQGPQGAGNFSQCVYKNISLSGNLDPVTSNSLGDSVKVIKGEPSVSFFFFKKASRVIVHNSFGKTI